MLEACSGMDTSGSASTAGLVEIGALLVVLLAVLDVVVELTLLLELDDIVNAVKPLDWSAKSAMVGVGGIVGKGACIVVNSINYTQTSFSRHG